MSDLHLPLFDIPEPIPYRGTTKASRAASLSGARQASKTCGVKQRRILDVLAHRLIDGGLTRQELSELTGIPINAVCSCLASLLKYGDVVSVGTVKKVWPDGGITTRETFRIAVKGDGR